MKDYARFSKGPRPPSILYKFLLIFCILISLGGLIYLVKDLYTNFQPTDTSREIALDTPIASAVKAPQKAIVKKEVAKATEPEKAHVFHKPKFDFYTLLPKMKMSSTVEESPALQKRPEQFVLQIASLQNEQAAEKLIQRLNSLGVKSSLSRNEQNGKTWIRVISKPYNNFQAAEKAQDLLHQNHIASLLVKTKA